jgi:hypothetical protein
VPGRPNADNSTEWMIQARSRLARRRAEKPATKAGQIRALWPDIEAALSVGQSMKTICAWLGEDAGITLGVTSLTSYVSRIRRREAASRHTPIRAPGPSDLKSANTFPTLTPLHTVALHNQSAGTSASDSAAKFDPLANYRARQGKDSGFNYRPATLEDEKDLI